MSDSIRLVTATSPNSWDIGRSPQMFRDRLTKVSSGGSNAPLIATLSTAITYVESAKK